MKLLFGAVAALLLAGGLSGCTTLGTIINEVGTVNTVSQQVANLYAGAPRSVFVARAGYDLALGAAAAFKTNVCPSITSHAFCATAVPALRAANHKALTALDAAESYVRTHPTLDPAAAIAAAQAAISAFAAVETANGVPAK